LLNGYLVSLHIGGFHQSPVLPQTKNHGTKSNPGAVKLSVRGHAYICNKKREKSSLPTLGKKQLREIIPDFLFKATVVVATISPS
jgi:hypothetical protein